MGARTIGLDVELIATAPAVGRAVVTAVHIPAEHAVYVICSRCGTQVAHTYGANAGRDEMRAGTTAAVICTHAHARGCTADRVKRHLVAATRQKMPVPLTDATREQS